VSELTDAQNVARGQRAELILDDPVFLEAMEDAEKRLLNDWKRSKPADRETREFCYAVWQGLRQGVFQSLQKFAGRGTVSQRKLNPDPGGVEG